MKRSLNFSKFRKTNYFLMSLFESFKIYSHTDVSTGYFSVYKGNNFFRWLISLDEHYTRAL
jgi:hypothetical protein